MTMQKPGEAAGLPRGKWLKLMYSIAQRGFADPVNQDLVTLNLQEMDAFANACFAAGAADVLAYSMEIHKQRDDLLAALGKIIANMDEDDGEAPGHCHENKGRWDKDGSQCEWCADWNSAKKLVAAIAASKCL